MQSGVRLERRAGGRRTDRLQSDLHSWLIGLRGAEKGGGGGEDGSIRNVLRRRDNKLAESPIRG